MRRWLLPLVISLALVIACSKKAAPPTAPPAPADPACALSAATLDFGTISVGVSADRQFTLSNSGGGTLSGTVTESCPEFSIVGTATYHLTAGQAAVFTVRFAPTSAGGKTCAVSTGSTRCAAVACSGVGSASAPSCSLTPSSLDFGTVPVGQQLDRVFTITNVGTTTLSGTVTSPCADLSLPGHSAYSLVPGQTDTLIVRFSPTSGGPQSCQLAVGGSCGTLTCTGSGQEACIVTPRSIDFGQVRYHATADSTFTLTNGGTGVLAGTIPAIHVLGFSLVGSGAYNLGPGQSATFTIRFAPITSHTGPYGGTVDLGTLCHSLDVSGSGTFGCDCMLSTTHLDFGNVTVGTTSATQEFTINNSSEQTITGAVRVLQGEFQAPSSYAAAPGVGQLLWAEFAPSRVGPQVGKIVFDRNGCTGPGQPCDTLICTGTGVLASPPQCGVSTNTIDMGTVYFGSNKDTTLTIRNLGGGILADSVKFLDNSPPFYALTRYYALGPGDSTSVVIRFSSSGTPGHTYSYVGNLFTGSQCIAQGLGVQVTAIAQQAPPICQVTPATLDFGTVAVGQSKDLILRVANVGAGVLSGSLIGCGPFTFIGATSYSLGAGQAVFLTVRFTPGAIGLNQCYISAGFSCSAVVARGTGN